MSLSSAATVGSGTFGGLPRCTKADLMKAHEAVAGGCGPRSCEGEAQTSVWAKKNRGGPGNCSDVNSK